MVRILLYSKIRVFIVSCIVEIASSKKPALDSDIAIQQQEHPGTIAASSQLVQLPPQDYSSVPTYIQPRELGHQTQRPPINSLPVKTDRAQLAANFVETVQALGTQSVTQSEVGYLPQVIFKKPVDQSNRAKSSDIARPRQIQRNEEPFHRGKWFIQHLILRRRICSNRYLFVDFLFCLLNKKKFS